MKIVFPIRRIVFATSAAVGLGLLSACYVVPIQPPAPATVVPVAPPVPVTFTARLYPTNDLATGYGMVTAVVTSDLNGRGHFSTSIGGESFSGEATRVVNSREGVANGTGQRGNFINCRYTMNSAAQGTGNCQMSTGATFSMHVGN